MEDTNKIKFKCKKCKTYFNYKFFIDDNDELNSICSNCRSINTDEKQCRRCKCKKTLDDFVWTSKDGKKKKQVLTCQKCRDTDKRFRYCEHNIRKISCKECHNKKDKL